MNTKHWLILLATGTGFGGSFAFNEILVAQYGALTVSAGRVAFGALGCWAWLAISRQSALVGVRVLLHIGIFGIFQFAAPFALLPFAQEQINSSTAGVANAMTPVAVIAISHLWPGGESANSRKAIGALCGLAGIGVIAFGEELLFDEEGLFVVFALLAPVCYGIALNLARSLRAIPPSVLITWAMTIGAFTILPLALAIDGIPRTPGFATLASFATLGIALTAVTFLVMYAILPKVGAVNLSLVTFIAPISALGIGYVLLGETLSPTDFCGVALVLSSLIVINGRLTLARVMDFAAHTTISISGNGNALNLTIPKRRALFGTLQNMSTTKT